LNQDSGGDPVEKTNRCTQHGYTYSCSNYSFDELEVCFAALEDLFRYS